MSHCLAIKLHTFKSNAYRKPCILELNPLHVVHNSIVIMIVQILYSSNLIGCMFVEVPLRLMKGSETGYSVLRIKETITIGFSLVTSWMWSWRP